jgi:pimeloyl-ACP methyl ester carboxylesterase
MARAFGRGDHARGRHSRPADDSSADARSPPHRRRFPVAGGRHLARWIPGARFVVLAGEDHAFWAGEIESVIAEIEEFLTARGPPRPRAISS